MNKRQKLDAAKSLHAIVPINKLSKCKSRLSRFISSDDRYRLVLAMFQDVLTVLVDHPYISKVTVIAGEPLRFPSEMKDFVELVEEKALDGVGGGLNSILAAGIDFVSEYCKDDFLILHGDLPLLSNEDITSILERLDEGYDLVLGADSRDEGTNLFAFRSDLRPKFNFGPSSNSNYKVIDVVKELSKSWVKSNWEIKLDKNNYSETKLLKLNCDKSLALLNWQPNLDFQTTMELTSSWYYDFYNKKNFNVLEKCQNQIKKFVLKKKTPKT